MSDYFDDADAKTEATNIAQETVLRASHPTTLLTGAESIAAYKAQEKLQATKNEKLHMRHSHDLRSGWWLLDKVTTSFEGAVGLLAAPGLEQWGVCIQDGGENLDGLIINHGDMKSCETTTTNESSSEEVSVITCNPSVGSDGKFLRYRTKYLDSEHYQISAYENLFTRLGPLPYPFQQRNLGSIKYILNGHWSTGDCQSVKYLNVPIRVK